MSTITVILLTILCVISLVCCGYILLYFYRGKILCSSKWPFLAFEVSPPHKYVPLSVYDTPDQSEINDKIGEP